MLAADERIDLALARHFVEVGGKGFERFAWWRFRLPFLFGSRRGLFGRFVVNLGNPVGNVVHHIQTGDVLLVEEIGRLGFLLAEDRHQHIGASDFLLAGGLHVKDRALQHTLKTQGRLCVAARGFNMQGRGLFQEGAQLGLQLVEVGAAGTQDLGRGRVIQQGQQQVFHGHELVALFARFLEGQIEGEFQFLAQHTMLPLSTLMLLP